MKIRPDVPGIAEIDVVGGNYALRKNGTRNRQQIAAAARIEYLRLRDQAQQEAYMRVPVGHLIGGNGGGNVRGGHRDPGSGVDLIHDRAENVDAVVVALMFVEIALVAAAELENGGCRGSGSGRRGPGCVLTVPEASERAAAIHRIRDKRLALSAAISIAPPRPGIAGEPGAELHCHALRK